MKAVRGDMTSLWYAARRGCGRSFGSVAATKPMKGTVMMVDDRVRPPPPPRPHVGSDSEGRAKNALNLALQLPTSRSSSSRDSRAGRRENSEVNAQQPSRLQYQIPQPYRELLKQLGSANDEGDRVAENPSAGTSAQKARDFWQAARKAARSRLDLPADSKPWERRISEMHESLYVEELNLELEMQRWRLTVDAVSVISEGLYTVDVTALSDRVGVPLEEKGLLRGVQVLIQNSDGNKYRAMVQPGSGSGTLIFSCSPSLAEASGPFDIEFRPLRFQQLAMHRALDAPQNESLLSQSTELQTPASSIHAEDKTGSLPPSLNEDQRRAVAAVLKASSRRPLVIWGPPGTGKSTLAAFIIWHLVQQRPTELRILAAAPSNTAADVLCRKLGTLGLDPEQMLRLNALGRSASTVPEDIRQYSFESQGEDGRRKYEVPPLKQAREYKVIVTTCICAAHLANSLKMAGAQGWFSHVVVDEAGEATEPETLVPLSLLRPVAGVAVLLGDHFQLGPLVVSRLANELGSLGTSMIERLANERFDAVRNDEEAGLSRDTLLACEDHGLFFLTESYRSHEAITSLYSKIFYASQLEHRARSQQLALMHFFESMGLQHPVVLHHVVGQERRDPDSASTYNLEEVRIVSQYIRDLIEDTPLGLEGRDVGVITPYNKQVRVLERQLASLGPRFAGVECGTVEWFQGQERRVILMSSVRCSRSAEGAEASMEAAARRPIGFVADPKRLNVAISRAVAGLVVVGDLRTLAAHSAHWRMLVRLGREMGVIRGEALESPKLRRVGDPKDAAATGPARKVPEAEASAAWDALTAA
mmetsp:Transcript_31535/g.57323  ORF Transcript_31535/g.57323 Transcript_31535/m.57323 type:complete len:817 (-) Transcript_31535:65-2515(-)